MGREGGRYVLIVRMGRREGWGGREGGVRRSVFWGRHRSDE